MRVLAADTSTAHCSVAICETGQGQRDVLAEIGLMAGRRHSELLLTLTRDALTLARLGLEDIDLLAISMGPGSFTGLRVGVATWKGLAFGARKPLMGTPTLDAMARSFSTAAVPVCPMLDARMDEVFTAVYEFAGGRPSKILDDTVAPPGEILSRLKPGTILFGDGAIRYRAEIEAHDTPLIIAGSEWQYPRASNVAFEAGERLEAGEAADAAVVSPMYLRKSQAEEARAAAMETATS